jgi:6-phosphogluconate dehydrogenase
MLIPINLAVAFLIQARANEWASIAAIEFGTHAPVLTAALLNRFTSRGEADYGDKLLSALRYEFG